jgi:hypothetical protein
MIKFIGALEYMIYVKIVETFDEYFQQTTTRCNFFTEYEQGSVDVSFLENGSADPTDYDGITCTNDRTVQVLEHQISSRWPDDTVFICWEELRELWEEWNN